jgi:hypothetical protein
MIFIWQMVHVTTTICGFDTCQGVFDTIKIDEVCQCHTNVQNISVFPQVFRLPPTIKLTVVIKLNNFVVVKNL